MFGGEDQRTPAQAVRKGRAGPLWAVAVFRPSRKSNPALATDLEPVYVRLPPTRFGAIRATAKHHRTSSPWPPKSAIVEAVAHLSIVMMESYALKELSEAEMLRVEKHVASCPKCRDHLDEELGWAAAMRSPFKRYVEKLIEAERKKAAKR
jgi:hypothetical protein